MQKVLGFGMFLLLTAPATHQAALAQSETEHVMSTPQSTTGTIKLWQNLQSGMSPSEVVSALQAQNIRAKALIDKSSGATYVKVKDRTKIGRYMAEIDIGFVQDRLFWVILQYEVIRSAGQRDETQFSAMSRAISQIYGPPLYTDISPDIVHSSSAGIVQRQGATFQHDDLKVDLTVNDSFGGDSAPRENVIIRYWSVTDAERYRKSQERKREREQQERSGNLKSEL